MKIITEYICFKKNSLVLGTASTLAIGFFASVQVVSEFKNIYCLFAVLGCFVAALHQVSIRDHNIKFKLIVGMLFSISMSLAITLGCYYSNDLIISSFMLLTFSFIVGYTAKSDLVFANGVLFVADMYVIGTGFSSDFSASLVIGMLSFVGAIFFILIFIVISRKTDVTETITKIQRSVKVILDKESTFYAISLSLGLIIGNFISIHFRIEIGYWIPMTVLLIFKPDVIRSSAAIKHRLFGTLIGSLFAIPLAIYLDNSYMILGLLFVTTFFTVCSIVKHYGSYVFFLTIFIAMLLKLAHMSGYEISISRLVYTLLGIVIVAVIIIISRLFGHLKV